MYIIKLNTLNLCNTVYQLYLSKAVNKTNNSMQNINQYNHETFIFFLFSSKVFS